MTCKKTYYNPSIVKDSWSTNSCVVHLANADYYLTKEQYAKDSDELKDWVQQIISDVEGLTSEKVEDMIDEKVSPLTKRIEELAESILSKDVLFDELGRYASVDGDMLTLNNENRK